jgi:hypothetical protein
VAEEDYQRQRSSLALEGAEILRSIDELQRDGVPDAAAVELEAAVAAMRGARSSSSTELEAAATEPRSKSSNIDSQISKAEAQGTCPACGEVIHPGDRFCSNCGEALEEQVV